MSVCSQVSKIFRLGKMIERNYRIIENRLSPKQKMGIIQLAGSAPSFLRVQTSG